MAEDLKKAFPQTRADAQRKEAIAGETPAPKSATMSQDPTWSAESKGQPLASPFAGGLAASALTSPPAAMVNKGKLGMPEWLGRPILHNDHSQELELNSAVNEFGLKMPRQQAEDQAYGDYIKGQRIQAAAHHLAGIKAATGAGDKEAARQHHMRYSLHTKALGSEPVGAPHPDVQALVDKGGQKVYKFKGHKGDAFLAQEPPAPEAGMPYQAGTGTFSSAPPLGKSERELLFLLHHAGTQLLAKAEKTEKKKAKHCKCEAYHFPHRHGGGYCRQKKPS